MDRKQAEAYLKSKRPGISDSEMNQVLGADVLGAEASKYLVDPNRIVSQDEYGQMVSEGLRSGVDERKLRKRLEQQGLYVEDLDIEAKPMDQLSALEITAIGLKNLPADFFDVAGMTVKALADKGTYTALWQLGKEAAQKAGYYSGRLLDTDEIDAYEGDTLDATESEPPDTPLLDTLVNFYAQTYDITSDEGKRNLKRYWASEPASLMADLLPLMGWALGPIGGAAGAAAKTVQAGSLASKVLGAARKGAQVARKGAHLADATNVPFLVARGILPAASRTMNTAKDATINLYNKTPKPSKEWLAEAASWVGHVATGEPGGAFHVALTNPTPAFKKALAGEPGYGLRGALRTFTEGLESYSQKINAQYKVDAKKLQGDLQEVAGMPEMVTKLLDSLNEAAPNSEFKLDLDSVRNLYMEDLSQVGDSYLSVKHLRQPKSKQFEAVADQVFSNPRYASFSPDAKRVMLTQIVTLLDEAYVDTSRPLVGVASGQGFVLPPEIEGLDIPHIEKARTASRLDDIKSGMGALTFDNTSIFPYGSPERVIMQRIYGALSDHLKENVTKPKGFSINYAEDLANPWEKKKLLMEEIKKEFQFDADKPMNQARATAIIKSLSQGFKADEGIRTELLAQVEEVARSAGGRGDVFNTLAGALLSPKVPVRVGTLASNAFNMGALRMIVTGKVLDPLALTMLAMSVPWVTGSLFTRLGEGLSAASGAAKSKSVMGRINNMSRQMVDVLAKRPFGKIADLIKAGKRIPPGLLETHASLVRVIEQGREREALALMLNTTPGVVGKALDQLDQLDAERKVAAPPNAPRVRTASTQAAAAMPASGTPALDLLQQQSSP